VEGYQVEEVDMGVTCGQKGEDGSLQVVLGETSARVLQKREVRACYKKPRETQSRGGKYDEATQKRKEM
jgi:hypothetical protein